MKKLLHFNFAKLNLKTLLDQSFQLRFAIQRCICSFPTETKLLDREKIASSLKILVSFFRCFFNFEANITIGNSIKNTHTFLWSWNDLFFQERPYRGCKH